MTENRPNEDNLREEFQTLGRNLADALRAAWEAPESKRLRDDVVTGLSDLGSTLRREADNLASSQAAQQVKTGVEQVGERLRTSDVQDKVRGELLGALQTLNGELQKVINRISSERVTPTGSSAASSDAPPMGNEAVAKESVPGIADEDPFRESVQPGETDRDNDPAI